MTWRFPLPVCADCGAVHSCHAPCPDEERQMDDRDLAFDEVQQALDAALHAIDKLVIVLGDERRALTAAASLLTGDPEDPTTPDDRDDLAAHAAQDALAVRGAYEEDDG